MGQLSLEKFKIEIFSPSKFIFHCFAPVLHKEISPPPPPEYGPMSAHAAHELMFITNIKLKRWNYLPEREHFFPAVTHGREARRTVDTTDADKGTDAWKSRTRLADDRQSRTPTLGLNQ